MFVIGGFLAFLAATGITGWYSASKTAKNVLSTSAVKETVININKSYEKAAIAEKNILDIERSMGSKLNQGENYVQYNNRIIFWGEKKLTEVKNTNQHYSFDIIFQNYISGKYEIVNNPIITYSLITKGIEEGTSYTIHEAELSDKILKVKIFNKERVEKEPKELKLSFIATALIKGKLGTGEN
jgi:hypothetical protein